MALSYKRLWKLLIDLDISKGDFAIRCDLPSGTMTKLRNDMPVHMKAIERICVELDCDIEDVVEVIREGN